MHDIICPRCGRKFIARDVVYDVSEFIYPLITDEGIKNNFQRNFGFKFLIDEQFILENSGEDYESRSDEMIPLSMTGTPNSSDDFFEFDVNSEVILRYIMNRIRFEKDYQKKIWDLIENILEGEDVDSTDSFVVFSSFITILNGILKAPVNARGAKDQSNSIRRNAITTGLVRDIYANCFSKNDRFDFENQGKQLVAILAHLTEIADNCVTLKMKLSCSSDGVPDELYIKTDREVKFIEKSCANCGIHFPKEFGHHKMIPIVFFGSHNSGKTTYLCSLNKAISSRFFSLQNISFVPLNTKDSVISQMLQYYSAGKACPKTEVKLDEVPNTAILVTKKANKGEGETDKSAIYIFVDGPGEIMVNDDRNAQNSDYNRSATHALSHARHLFCFVTPEQVLCPEADEADDEYEENVAYSPNTISNCLDYYVKTITGRANHRFSTITTVINKFDRYSIEDHSELAAQSFSAALAEVNEQVNDQMVQAKIYDKQTGLWNDEIWENFSGLMEEFIFQTNAEDVFRNIKDTYEEFSPVFIPVAPMGFTAQSASLDDKKTNRTPQPLMVAIPLLYVLYKDGMLKNAPKSKK